MKAIALFIALTPFAIFGQITITSADFATAGDTVRLSTTTEPSIDFSSTGANHSWDFSMLVAESQTLYDYQDLSNVSFLVNAVFGSFAPPKYHASYFMASDDLPLDLVGGFLPVSITDVYQFSKLDSDSLRSLGFAITVEGNEVPFKSDTIETRYKFPMNFNDAYSSRGYTNMDLNPITNIVWVQYRTRNSVVDGWGSVTTPYGTFQALRVKHAISEVDTLTLDVMGNPFTTGIPVPDSHIYEWWTNGEDDAILRIETRSVGGNEVVSNIEYRDNYDPNLAGIEETTLSMELYPNPASDAIKISGVAPGTAYSIVNINGEVVLQGELNSEGEINLSNISRGQYAIVLTDGRSLFNSTFIKE